MTRRALAVGLLVGLAAIPRAARGQNSGGIPVDATVIGVGMTITTLRDLAFGQVTKGIATSVLPTDAGAGEWQVLGNKNAFTQITFTLPTQLSNIQALPGSTMPITFSATSARWRRDLNNPSGATAFNPAVGTTGRFGPATNATLYIWIGGTVSPAAGAKPGVYVGNVVVSLVYL